MTSLAFWKHRASTHRKSVYRSHTARRAVAKLNKLHTLDRSSKKMIMQMVTSKVNFMRLASDTPYLIIVQWYAEHGIVTLMCSNNLTFQYGMLMAAKRLSCKALILSR